MRPGGARTIPANTEFSGPQIRDVAAREGGKVIIYDDEYSEAVKLAETPLGKASGARNKPDAAEPSGSTDRNPRRADLPQLQVRPPKATKRSSIIILTSGTTGTPKGANWHAPAHARPHRRVLSAVPFKSGEVTALPSPMFHALGYLHATIAMTLGSTLILHRRFKPAVVLEDIAAQR